MTCSFPLRGARAGQACGRPSRGRYCAAHERLAGRIRPAIPVPLVDAYVLACGGQHQALEQHVDFDADGLRRISAAQDADGLWDGITRVALARGADVVGTTNDARTRAQAAVDEWVAANWSTP